MVGGLIARGELLNAASSDSSSSLFDGSGCEAPSFFFRTVELPPAKRLPEWERIARAVPLDVSCNWWGVKHITAKAALYRFDSLIEVPEWDEIAKVDVAAAVRHNMTFMEGYELLKTIRRRVVLEGHQGQQSGEAAARSDENTLLSDIAVELSKELCEREPPVDEVLRRKLPGGKVVKKGQEKTFQQYADYLSCFEKTISNHEEFVTKMMAAHLKNVVEESVEIGIKMEGLVFDEKQAMEEEKTT
ncbi:hypothetical protein G7K_6685-t1 [Saitoella complicata NRRL Y-17804]|uniref:Uncharacterized protein n=1 Tax=Saitoella complicata (strain BCRC 22490 / CBS 7301 / JCM 7358 / NBRC 10748 / NRRL Y-17804) TaxID=698492 RepID=A0A0E9NRV7_SAICN|nr:hypothetical protein G7K_6685-t1 [Saitoella complicata NRRL Y-17804]